MAVDLIRYDLLVQDALRGMVRHVLSSVARDGLPGEHHFYITFQTHARGVRLSERMRDRYPDEMTIVLQHQFWDLRLTEQAFEVGLSFQNISEMLLIPFGAITRFADPAAGFEVQFAAAEETAESDGAARQRPPVEGQAAAPAPPAQLPLSQDERPQTHPEAADIAAPKEPAPAQSARKVISIESFRKKS